MILTCSLYVCVRMHTHTLKSKFVVFDRAVFWEKTGDSLTLTISWVG